jgi:hypothetical protein
LLCHKHSGKKKRFWFLSLKQRLAYFGWINFSIFMAPVFHHFTFNLNWSKLTSNSFFIFPHQKLPSRLHGRASNAAEGLPLFRQFMQFRCWPSPKVPSTPFSPFVDCNSFGAHHLLATYPPPYDEIVRGRTNFFQWQKYKIIFSFCLLNVTHILSIMRVKIKVYFKLKKRKNSIKISQFVKKPHIILH